MENNTCREAGFLVHRIGRSEATSSTISRNHLPPYLSFPFAILTGRLSTRSHPRTRESTSVNTKPFLYIRELAGGLHCSPSRGAAGVEYMFRVPCFSFPLPRGWSQILCRATARIVTRYYKAHPRQLRPLTIVIVLTRKHTSFIQVNHPSLHHLR